MSQSPLKYIIVVYILCRTILCYKVYIHYSLLVQELVSLAQTRELDPNISLE